MGSHEIKFTVPFLQEEEDVNLLNKELKEKFKLYQEFLTRQFINSNLSIDAILSSRGDYLSE